MTTLSEHLLAVSANFAKQASSENLDTMRNCMQQLINAKIDSHALTSGDTIPTFSLPDHMGNIVTSQSLLSQSPVVINFYRGGWCPYCNLELAALQSQLTQIESSGAKLVAISPELPDHSLQTLNKNALHYPVLSDKDNILAKQFGIVFELPQALRPLYKKLGIDIVAHNGNERFELPIPASYIVDKDGTIRYHYINIDYTQRLEPNIIVDQLHKLFS